MATFKQYSQTLNDASEAFSIDSFTSDEIKVRVDKVLKTAGTHYDITSYTTNGGTVTWKAGHVPAENAVVRIYRITDTSSAKATYAAGSSVKAGDLNDNQTQLLRAIDEENDQFIQTWDVEPDAIDGTKIKDDSIDSEHYVDGSIDLAHMSANSVDSDQYVDGSIDLIHLSANSVDSSKIVDDSIVNADIKSDAAILGSKLQASTGSNAGTMSAAHFTKLEGIEAGATGNQTNAEIRAAVEAASDSNVFTDADHSKLNGIEASATADQTNAEIRAAVEAATDSNVFTDVDHSKLNGIEAGADVTDTANVTAAGAVMKTTVDAKGDLLAASANDTVTKLAVGTNDYVLTADSSTATGLKWAAAGAGGQANQNAFSNVAVSGQTTVAADTTTDTLTIVGGTNVTVTTDASADSVTIAASGGEVTVQDEGSSLSTAATTLNFVGAGVVASGTGATKTITISGGGGAVTTDYQYLELKAHNNTSGAFSAGSADYELVTKGTTTAVSPDQAAAMLISIGGVLQEPNTGTSIGSNDGFCIDGSSIHFGANLTAHPEYIIWMKGSGSHTLDDNSVTGAKIALGSDAAGDIMYYNGTDYVRLAKGTNGHYLKQGTSNAPEWAAVSGGSDTTYAISCVDGDNSDEEKIRLTAGGSGSGTDDVVLEAGTGLSVARSGDKITFTNTVTDTNTQLTEEQVEDFVGGMVTGNTETGITVTYEDSDGTLDFVVDDTTKLPLAGGTITGDVIFDNATHAGFDLTWDMSDKALEFTDGTKAVFGDGSDLSIHHDGSHSYIKDAGTGSLILVGSGITFQNAAESENMLTITENGSVDLYFDGVKELSTIANGIELTSNTSASGTTQEIRLSPTATTGGTRSCSIQAINTDGNNNNALAFKTCAADTPAERLRITQDGLVRVPDNGKFTAGASDDLQIFHDGTDTHIDNNTSNLRINSNDIQLRDSAENFYIDCNNGGSVDLYYDGSKILNTESYGALIKRPSGGSTVLQIEGSEGNHATINMFADDGDNDNDKWQLDAQTGNAFILYNKESGSWEKSFLASGGGAFNLYYDNSKKAETTSGGFSVPDVLYAGNKTAASDANSCFVVSTGFGSDGCGAEIHHTGNSGSNRDFIRFYNTNAAEAGSIEHSSSTAVAFNTSSDYRLKENIALITDGITKLKLLKPSRFTWKDDPDKGLFDGFIAHEVTPACPTAVSGEKDAERMQRMDYSKLTPLLTAALQEAIAKIETLETKVAALEAG